MAYGRKKDYRNRSFIVGGIFLLVAVVYVSVLFYLQIVSDEYEQVAANNATFVNTLYPSRGLIYDRNGKLIVSNKPVYDVMLIMREMQGFDTLEFCNTLEITKAQFDERIAEIKDRKKNRSYSRFKPQMFMAQIPAEQYARLQEKLYRFPGVFVQNRVLREYAVPHAALAIGSIGEVNAKQMEEDEFYSAGDLKGQSGVERMYETYLRGEKGRQYLMRDVHGRIKGSFNDGKDDIAPVPGKNITLGLDIDLQQYGEELMQNKLGCIVALEPSSGEILSLVSSPSYDPSLLVGRERSANYAKLLADPQKPLFDRPMMAMYPPGSTFKLVMSALMQQEKIITANTRFPCKNGYYYARGRRLGCHDHKSPINLQQAIRYSCNAYFCYCLKGMLDDNAGRYGSTKGAYDKWREYVMSFGFGHELGVDFPNEQAGFIMESSGYDRIYGKGSWRSATVISISIGQGEILATPMQIANLAAIVANKGSYHTPHIIKNIEGGGIPEKYKEIHHTMVDSVYFDVIHDGMFDAVTQGTASIGLIKGIDFCGKTGTAENPHGNDHSIFVAFAPKDDPKIALAVYVENGGFGAVWAVPIASLMIEKYLKGQIDPRRKWLEDYVLNGVIDPRKPEDREGD